MANITRLIIGINGEIIDKKNGYIVAGNAYSNNIQIISPFPSSDSVKMEFYLRNARIKTHSQYIGLMKDDSNVPVLAKDVVGSNESFYQTVKDWNVWQGAIEPKILTAILRYHAGTIDLTAKFYEFRNLYVEEAITYMGTFGSRKSTTKGDLPSNANVGEYYECDYLDYYSTEATEEFTVGDYAYFTATGWLKGDSYMWRRNSQSTPLGIDPGVQGMDIDTLDLNTGEQLASRVSGIESVILGQLPENYVDDLFVRKELDLNYSKISPLTSDQIVIERDRVTHYADIDDLTKGLNEVESDIIRTSGVINASTGSGLYADGNSILIGNSAGDNISWDGNKIYFNGTIRSGNITDPELLESLKGEDGYSPVKNVDYFDGQPGYTPVLGVDYFSGSNGTSMKYIGELTYLSDLTLIASPNLNDVYKVLETNELWLFNGSIWVTMGKFEGEDAKYLTVRGETVFKYNPGESIPTNPEILLTAYLFGGLNIYDWQYHNGTNWITLNNNTATFILHHDSPIFIGDLARIRCRSNNDLYDEHTIVNIVDGTTYNTYWAYADTADGSGVTFSTSYYANALYMGRYQSLSDTQSTTYTDYTWSRFKGDTGPQGPSGTSVVLKGSVATFGDLPIGATAGDLYVVLADGDGYVSDGADNWTNVGAVQGPAGNNADPLYWHTAYADTSDGSGATFSITYYEDALYKGELVDTNVADPGSSNYSLYDWSRLKGEAGEDSVYGDLTTYHVAFTADNDGTNYDLSGFSSNFTTYKGITDVTSSTSFTVTTATIGGLTCSIGATTGIITLSGASWLGEEAIFELTGLYNGVTIRKQLTVTKTLKGPTGSDPAYVKVTGEQSFKYLTDATEPIKTSIEYEATLFGNLTTYQWQYHNGTIWTNLSGISTSGTYILEYNNSAWGSNSILRIRCLSGTLYDEVTVVKLYDGLTGEAAIAAYLTDENVTVPANFDGTGYDTSSVGGTFRVFYGLTDVTTSCSFTVTNETLDGLTLSIGASTGVYSLETDDDTWVSNYTSFELNATYGSVTISKRFTISKARVGSQGLTGPGLSFRGVFDQTKIYYKDVIRQDIVEYPADSQTYYAVNETIPAGAWDPSEWTQLTSFSSIATDILLAQNATITKGLVMGDGTNDGFIRSYSKTALGTGSGFYLNGDGKFNFGNSAGNNIDWDGTDLTVKGDIQADSLQLLNDAVITKGLTMGSSTTKGFIASYGMSSLTDATGGYYIAGDGQFVFGKPGFSSLKWDGNILTEEKPFTVREWYQPTEKTLSMEITNNTSTTKSYYYRYWEDAFGDGTPSSWTLADTIDPGITEYHSITNLKFAKYYYVEHREGSDNATIQGQYLSTSNVLVNANPAHTGWSSSSTGGAGSSFDVKIETAIKSGLNEVWTITGTATLTDPTDGPTETVTISMPHEFYYATLQVTVDSTNSAGGGLDGVYGKVIETLGKSSSFSITHDYTDTTNSRTFMWTLTGFKLTL